MTNGLILVDLQNDYFPGGRMPLQGIAAAGANAGILLDLFRDRGWPTIHIQHVALKADARFFLPDTPGVQLYEGIRPLPGERVIRKHFPNSFRETDLGEGLKAAGVERVVVCGAMSHMCIDATTRAAADLGFDCVVIQDACATKDLEFQGRTIAAREVHGAFMAALGGAYAQVSDLDAFLSEARHSA